MELTFTCPHCGGTRIIEVQDNCLLCTKINAIHLGLAGKCEIDYGDQETEYGNQEVSLVYECESCGRRLSDAAGDIIADPEELFAFLLNQRTK